MKKKNSQSKAIFNEYSLVIENKIFNIDDYFPIKDLQELDVYFFTATLK